MPLIQIVIVGFALFALAKVVSKFREGQLSAGRLALWCAVWVGVAVVTLLPQTTSRLADILGVGRGVDVVIYAAIVLLYYFVFRIFLHIERLEHEITVLVRELGLRKDGEEDRREDGS